MKNETQSSFKTLHYQFVKLGNHRRRLTNKLLALLPEIYQQEIFKKYARTIEEYAGRFGGLSGSVVRKRLRLEKYVHDKPELRDAIRTEGVHKVALVASLATKENAWMLADKVKNMSKPAVQELSKELRAGLLVGEDGVCADKACGSVNQSLFGDGTKVGSEAMASGAALKSVSCKAIPTKITIELDEDMSFTFLKLKQQLGKNLSNREAMKKILEMAGGQKVVKNFGRNSIRNLLKTGRPKTLSDQKVIPGDTFEDTDVAGKSWESLEKNEQKNLKNPEKPNSSYIKVSFRREKLAETGGKCSYPGCNKPAENFHHTEPRSEGGSHYSIKPLCKIHHEFMHNGLVENQQMEAANWQLSLSCQLTYADYWYRYYRKS